MQLVLENEKHEPTFLFKILVLIGLVLFFVACSTPNVKRYSYQPTANPVEEMRKLDSEMQQEDLRQIAVFAPKSYPRAQSFFLAAKKQQAQGASAQSILRNLSEARSYFEHAKLIAEKSRKSFSPVANARENALMAGAVSNQMRALKKADSHLIDVTEEFENGSSPDIAVQKRADLQREYLDLELASIRASRLTDARTLLESARRQGAQKFAPQAFQVAQSSLKNAELTIGTDRHNEELISAVSAKAEEDARRALRVTDLVRKTGRPGSEDLAMKLILQEEELTAKSQEAAKKESQLEAQMKFQESQLSERQVQLQRELAQAKSRANEAQKELEAKRKVDAVYAGVQTLFDKDEAQVYRQGNNLIIRMKSIQFQPGRAELPTSAFETLGKVHRVIDELKAKKIIVEGHTDSTGGQEINQKISQDRADAVAQFLKQQDESRLSGGADPEQSQQKGSDLQIEPLGYGDQYPIATNKTKHGRALNRRVDIIIAPEIITE